MASASLLIGRIRASCGEVEYRDGKLLITARRSLLNQVLDELHLRREEIITCMRQRECVDCGAPAGSGQRCSPCAAARVVRESGPRRRRRR